MDENLKDGHQNKDWIIYAAIAIVAVTIICGVLVGSLYYLQQSGRSLPFSSELQTLMAGEGAAIEHDQSTPAAESQTRPSFALPTMGGIEIPTRKPGESITSTPIPTATTPNLTGNQYLDNTTLIDDFSSDSLGWPVVSGGDATIQYENETYTIQVRGANSTEIAIAPAPFNPSYILFDVWRTPGVQQGTFSVFCQYQDARNYYFIEFDLQNRKVQFGQMVDNVFIPLTVPDANLSYWIPVDALKLSPENVNTIGVDCRLGVINLLVNDEFVRLVPVNSPFDNPGGVAFSVSTSDNTGPEGYQVFFDNVFIR